MPSLSHCLIGTALCLTLIGISGCHKQPRAELQKSHAQSVKRDTGNKPTFGSFDLRKRHGLGDWQGQSGPSREELLERMGQAKDPTSANRVKTGEPR